FLRYGVPHTVLTVLDIGKTQIFCLAKRDRDEYFGFDDHDYIKNIMPEDNKLLFFRKIFREIEERVTDPPCFLDYCIIWYVNAFAKCNIQIVLMQILKSRIFYVDPSILILQLVHDYRSRNYSTLNKADVEKLSALLILGEIGYDAHAPLRSNWRLIRDESKPFYTHRGYNPRNQLLCDIEITYLSLKNLTEDDAKQEFIRILSELSYGKSVFYNVEKIYNPADLRDKYVYVNIVPAIPCIMHNFFDLKPRRLLHSTHFKDIKRIGSSSTALILERRADILGFRTDLV
ncbi:hypothetical protein Tco_1230763, partial [Tanacetum coccineum]